MTRHRKRHTVPTKPRAAVRWGQDNLNKQQRSTLVRAMACTLEEATLHTSHDMDRKGWRQHDLIALKGYGLVVIEQPTADSPRIIAATDTGRLVIGRI